MMVNSLGIVAGLSWNDAIRSLFAVSGPFHEIRRGGVWLTAVGITLVALIMAMIFTHYYPDEQGNVGLIPSAI